MKNLSKTEIDGLDFTAMISLALSNLSNNVSYINDLNVFPIPDGDTGENMFLTLKSGLNSLKSGSADLGDVSEKIAFGMLLGARGNSGVILSQFFDGLSIGLKTKSKANCEDFIDALSFGVAQAYNSVLTPVEGTMLTVARLSVEQTKKIVPKSFEELFSHLTEEAYRALQKTPELLPILKEANVVDSGGAGFLHIIEGMYSFFKSDRTSLTIQFDAEKTNTGTNFTNYEPNYNAFTSDSILEFGYCTELLLRIQNSKISPNEFDIKMLTDYLSDIGDSVAAFRHDTMVKIHVHTSSPHLVLEHCQKYGEFLKVKIENMSLQHNNILPADDTMDKYAIVAVCSGDGIKQLFKDCGATSIIDGGQSMNPSTNDFLRAFDNSNAENIFVFPNNSNIISTAKQAAKMYSKSNIIVIESQNIGEGYSAISLFDPQNCTVEELNTIFQNGIKKSLTLSVSQSIKNTKDVQSGNYISFIGKEIISCSDERIKATIDGISKIDINDFDIFIIISGKCVPDEEIENIQSIIKSSYPKKEVYLIKGMQEIYDYIIIFE